MIKLWMIGLGAISLVGFAAQGHPHSTSPTTQATASTEAMIQQVAAVHGAAGPFAMAGYRMAQHAMRALRSKRWDWSLRALHATPHKVQWSCIADGVQAATGVSAGKLSLRIKKVKTNKETLTLIWHRKRNIVIRYRLTPSFVKRFLHTPRQQLKAAARQVATLPESQIFAFKQQAKPIPRRHKRVPPKK